MAFSFASKYNTEKLFNVDTEGLEYISLEELYNKNGEDKIYAVHAIYINKKGYFDPAPVVATKDNLVNLPSHLTEMCECILNDRQAVATIKSGLCGFKINKYFQKKYKKYCYSIQWIDIYPSESDEIPFDDELPLDIEG